MRKKGKYSVFRIANPNIHRGWIANPAQLTPAQTLLPIRTAVLGLLRPEEGSEQSARGNALGMRATHKSAQKGQKH